MSSMLALQLTSMMTLSVSFILLIAFSFALTGWYNGWKKHQAASVSRGQTGSEEKPRDPYTTIKSTPGFKWQDEAPIAFRPFKPKYHLTMSIESMTLDELVPVDKTYLERIELRRQLMHNHQSTVGIRPGGEAAVGEFYTWMTKVYLPKRFPSMYKLEESEKRAHLRNLVTSESIPLEPTSARSALRTLGAHVDNDFLFLLPSTETEIHKPVPGYAAKIEKSMDRFFASMPCGKFVRRANWTVTTTDALFSESGTHLYNEDKEEHAGEIAAKPNLEDDISRQKAEVVVANCRLRCERQTLHRLPENKAIVFAFKTYQYTLKEVKDEGSGPALAEAIQGLGQGNVPEFQYYKRGVVWGDKVREYLLA